MSNEKEKENNNIIIAIIINSPFLMRGQSLSIGRADVDNIRKEGERVGQLCNLL